MRNTKAIVHSAIVGVVTFGFLGTMIPAQAQPATPPKYTFEKCYGIAKAGKNDCQTAASSCAGTSKTERQADAWIFVPKGTCGKIVGGSMKPKT